jgi:hypothetical protein
VPNVHLIGWHPSLRKVSLTEAIIRYTGYDLAAAKHLTDTLLDGAPIELPLLDGVDPAQAITALEALGTIVRYELESTKLDSARLYLLTHDYPSHVVQGGLMRLLDDWERLAVSVAKGQEQEQDDYLNDVDGRHILAAMLPSLDSELHDLAVTQLARIDSIIRPHLVPTSVCIWGSDNEAKYGYDRERHWWYYHRPRIVDRLWRDR